MGNHFSKFGTKFEPAALPLGFSHQQAAQYFPRTYVNALVAALLATELFVNHSLEDIRCQVPCAKSSEEQNNDKNKELSKGEKSSLNSDGTNLSVTILLQVKLKYCLWQQME